MVNSVLHGPKTLVLSLKLNVFLMLMSVLERFSVLGPSFLMCNNEYDSVIYVINGC